MAPSEIYTARTLYADNPVVHLVEVCLARAQTKVPRQHDLVHNLGITYILPN